MHAGAQSEAKRQRQVEIETELVAFGAVAESLARLPAGRTVRVAGFLDRKGVNNPQLELHVTEFGLIEE